MPDNEKPKKITVEGVEETIEIPYQIEQLHEEPTETEKLPKELETASEKSTAEYWKEFINYKLKKIIKITEEIDALINSGNQLSGDDEESKKKSDTSDTVEEEFPQNFPVFDDALSEAEEASFHTGEDDNNDDEIDNNN